MKKKISFKEGANEAVEIVAILDKSGSMAGLRDDAIGGYNSFLKEQQKLDVKANLTTILFASDYQVVEDRTPVANVKPMTTSTYFPMGSTAMNDAIGKALSKLMTINPKRAVIAILTDGQENASKEFTTPQIKTLIEKCQDKDWEIVYLAANQDAFAVAHNYGMNLANVANFAANAIGTRSAFRGLTASLTSYTQGGTAEVATTNGEIK